MSPVARPLALTAEPILCTRECRGDRFAENGTGRHKMNHAIDIELAGAAKLRSDRITDTRQVQPSAPFAQ